MHTHELGRPELTALKLALGIAIIENRAGRHVFDAQLLNDMKGLREWLRCDDCTMTIEISEESYEGIREWV